MKLRIPTARAFKPLLQPKRYKAAFGGRGSAKSHFFAGMLVEECVLQPGTRAVCTREVQKSLKDSAKLLIEDKIRQYEEGPLFEIQHDQIRTPGGGLIAFTGMKDHTAESVKSLEGFRIAWAEEARSMSARSLELLKPTIRAPGSELWFSWNPTDPLDPVDQMFRANQDKETDKDMASVRVNYMDNPWFPDVLEIERQRDLRTNPQRYGHIWLGEYEPMVQGAIWTRQVFHQYRVDVPPDLGRIVVAVDPAVSSEPHSDEHGIIAAGIDRGGRGYVLDDLSTRGTPEKWATRAIAAYDKWDADAIVVERNQGGDMVAHTLKTIRSNIRIVEVVATRGKHLRAEPIAALYNLGKISHCGLLPELEAQMCQMTSGGYEGTGSPDRVDAAVYALTELFPKMVSRLRPPSGMRAVSEYSVFGD